MNVRMFDSRKLRERKRAEGLEVEVESSEEDVDENDVEDAGDVIQY